MESSIAERARVVGSVASPGTVSAAHKALHAAWVVVIHGASACARVRPGRWGTQSSLAG